VVASLCGLALLYVLVTFVRHRVSRALRLRGRAV